MRIKKGRINLCKNKKIKKEEQLNSLYEELKRNGEGIIDNPNTEDATATAEGITEGKTEYVNGEEIWRHTIANKNSCNVTTVEDINISGTDYIEIYAQKVSMGGTISVSLTIDNIKLY